VQPLVSLIIFPAARQNFDIPPKLETVFSARGDLPVAFRNMLTAAVVFRNSCYRLLVREKHYPSPPGYPPLERSVPLKRQAKVEATTITIHHILWRGRQLLLEC